MHTRIAVDTGGTFTDFVLLGNEGLRVHKVRSTPGDPSRAILQGLSELAGDEAVTVLHRAEVIHGSTVATNALLERKGARVAFLTTAGFEELLDIGRQTRRELYRLWGEERRPLVERTCTFGVRERVAAGGEVIQILTDGEIARLLGTVQAVEPESVAICLLHSYANNDHEARLARAFRDAGFTVSESHAILPEQREFERASTTAVNAYVAPVMSRYLRKLEQGVGASVLRISQSSGGFFSTEDASRHAVKTVLSGPAGGAVGALALARASGLRKVIAFDMGGTSTDVTLLDDGLPMTNEATMGDFPVRLPMLDIHTVGAGGGSVAYLDGAGALRVGPRSAGAHPGPACYGSGSELTVTDANLLLGRLHAEGFLGGRMRLDEAPAAVLAGELAAAVGCGAVELADGIVRLANASMERALRVVSVQRGYDPRDFALLAFGGAGGMHACDLARSLDIRTVLVPEHAGLLSAMGMLMADYVAHDSESVLTRADEITVEDLERRFQPLLARAAERLRAADFPEEAIRMERSLDVRYLGQSYEITVPFTAAYRQRFDGEHQRRYGYSNGSRPAEVVNLRVNAVAETEKPQLQKWPLVSAPLPKPICAHSAVFGGVRLKTQLLDLDLLSPGMRGEGPAVIAGRQSTTVIPPGWTFQMDAVRTLVLQEQAVA